MHKNEYKHNTRVQSIRETLGQTPWQAVSRLGLPRRLFLPLRAWRVLIDARQTLFHASSSLGGRRGGSSNRRL